MPLPQLQWFATEAVDPAGDAAYGTYHTTTAYGVGQVDFGSGRLRFITSAPASKWGGVLWMNASPTWLVWAESLPNIAGAWDLKAWNIHTGESRLIASSRLLAGQYTFPVVEADLLAWSEATSPTSADIRVYRFSNGLTSVLDSGVVSPPVFAGKYLVWAKVPTSSSAKFQMVDSTTLAPEETVAALSGSQSVVYLAGSAGYLLWTESNTLMDAFDFSADRVTQYHMAQIDGRHAFQFPMLAGNILVWWTGVQDTVVDLSTGNGFDVVNGAAAGAGDLVVISSARGNVPLLSAMRLNGSTDISTCA